MIRPRKRCGGCGGQVEVMRVILKRADRVKGTTDDRREAWRCVDCDAVQLEKVRPTEGVDKSN